ncbi:stage V sporulation protein E [Selenomonas sp. TAMA-11512]|uniref:FtsW/RodA/SpoVE family cell cycle protein n=1 Tax=Selenomonas sp. TAMA-11512 TaxID=3095337 RepID=UPI00308E6C82|nr:stage V sporulation protein E [Selenomonas sp. TAMA-11512]
MAQPVEKPKKVFWVSDMEAVLTVFLVLLVLGTMNVFSSSFIMAQVNYDQPYYYFLYRQLINLAVGFVCFIIACRVDYHRWRDWIVPVVLLTIVALVVVLVAGVEVNGSKRWLSLGPLPQIQPAEIAKLVALMLVAAYAAHRVHNNLRINIINPQMAIIALMAALIELEPDGGTMSIVLAVPFLVLMIAGLHKWKVISTITLGIIGIAALSIVQPYRMERFKVLLDPWADAQGIGYQTVQSLSAIGSGGLTGMGLGMGVSKYSYLPEAHTDFAFAIFSQETGFLGVTLMLFLFAALTIYGARIANAAQDAYGQFLAAGVLLLIVTQAIINLLMVAGILPVIGVPLPFISYGGTSLMVSMASIGILINIGHQSARAAKKREREERLKGIQETLETKQGRSRHLELVK